MKPIISVIIPVYNVESYLAECLDSVLSQSMKEVEIILVNDGSTDSSGNICDEYKDRDNRVKVIHKQNEGVSVARNTGIANSIGKYIGFVDSDDVIDKDMYKKLYSEIEDNNADIAICRYARLYPDGVIRETEEPLKLGELGKEEIKEKLILPMIGTPLSAPANPPIMGCNWRCLYRKKIISKLNIEFQKVKIAEDLLFHLTYLCKSQKAIVIDDVLYYYRLNPNSALQSYITNYWDDRNKQFELLYNVLKDNYALNGEIVERLNSTRLYFTCSCIINECHKKNEKNLFEKLRTMKNYVEDKRSKDVLKWKNIKNISFKERFIFSSVKLKLFLVVYFYFLYKQREVKR